MKDQIDCRIGSGQYLRFNLFKEGRPLSPMGGNFLYVRESEDGWKVIFAGQTDNLALHAQERWGEARDRFGAEGLYTRLNITTAVRRREHADILEAFEPPMNADEAQPSSPLDASSDDASAVGF